LREAGNSIGRGKRHVKSGPGEGPRGEVGRGSSITESSGRGEMEVGSFEETLHDFIREGGWRDPKGVDERLVRKIYVQITDIRLRISLP